MALLEVQEITKHQPDKTIVDHVSFQQEAGQRIAITGESGSGKSTLLRMISGQVQADEGLVLFNGKKVQGPQETLLAGHQDIAYLSQHYELHNNYIVKDLIWFQVKIEETEATRLFDICRITHLLHRKTNHLSGGEKQRIALCMLLIKYPTLLVLDEPFSNLDPINKNTLKAVLEDVTARLQITCLLASHDPQDTLSWAEKIIVMRDGRIVQKGSPSQIYHYPVNEYVAGLFGKFNVLTPNQAAWFGIGSHERLIVRPEDFRISAQNGQKGVIKKTGFHGSYYEAEILVRDLTIIIHTRGDENRVGEQIYVTVVNRKNM